MFKRVAKRQRKREKEEELGLDEDMKQVLGLQDTDSDESVDSDSDFGSGSKSDDSLGKKESGNDDADPASHKRKRPTQKLSSSSDEEDQILELETSDPQSESDPEDDDDGGPPMSVVAATTDPIYDLPGAPATQDLRTCIICPGKLIKNTKMAKVHLESAAHLRRMKRYTAEVSRLTSGPDGLTTNDPRDILRLISSVMNSGVSDPAGTSKRSQRRNQWKAKRAERKKVRKEKRAKMATDMNEKDTGNEEKNHEESPKKKRKTKAHVADIPPLLVVTESSFIQNPVQEGNTVAPGPNVRPAPELDAITLPRPKKRRKREVPGGGNNSPSPPLNAVSISPVTVDSNKAVGRLPREKRGAPPLKRHDTSLYFADDEKPQVSGLHNILQLDTPREPLEV